MTIYKHDCLEGPTERLGDAWDCVKCRVRLLDAFRPAPEVSMPHLVLDGHGRTVDLNPAEPETARPDELHSAVSGAQPYSDGRPGGIWRAVCRCGWREEGKYARDTGEAPARKLAHLKVLEHLKNEGAVDE